MRRFLFWIFFIIEINIVLAVYKAGSNASKRAKHHLGSSGPSLLTPDVATCRNGQRYIVNHIVYICLSKDNGTQKTLLPTGKI